MYSSIDPNAHPIPMPDPIALRGNKQVAEITCTKYMTKIVTSYSCSAYGKPFYYLIVQLRSYGYVHIRK